MASSSLFLPLQNRIAFQIGHVDFLALFDDVRMLFAHQPANVREKESSSGVVRIGISVGELVVHSMISCPMKDWLLASHRLQDHHYDFELLIHSEGFVSKQSMSSNCCTQTSQDSINPSNYNRRSSLWNIQAVECKYMQI